MIPLPDDRRRRARRGSTPAALALALGLVLWLAGRGGSWAMPAGGPAGQTTGPGCLVGQVTVPGAPPGGTIPAPCRPYTLYVQVCGQIIPPCTATPCIIPVNADEYGQFTLCGLAPGTYDLTARGPNTLANLRTGIVISDSTIPLLVDLGSLPPGDASGDNRVGILDFSFLVSAYGSHPGDPRWDARADFDCSGSIDILDWCALATEYGRAGAACPQG